EPCLPSVAADTDRSEAPGLARPVAGSPESRTSGRRFPGPELGGVLVAQLGPPLAAGPMGSTSLALTEPPGGKQAGPRVAFPPPLRGRDRERGSTRPSKRGV